MNDEILNRLGDQVTATLLAIKERLRRSELGDSFDLEIIEGEPYIKDGETRYSVIEGGILIAATPDEDGRVSWIAYQPDGTRLEGMDAPITPPSPGLD